MGRSIEPLTAAHLAALGSPVSDRVFWEVEPVRRARLSREEAVEAKRAWVADVESAWGPPGIALCVDEVLVGAALCVPPAFAPGAGGLPTAPVSPDALLLTTVYVDPAQRGGGLGKLLVQATAREAVRRGEARAIEAFGSRRRPLGRPGPARDDRLPEADLVPVGFWEAVGFGVHRDHGTSPRLRMDLRTTLRWRVEAQQALGRLIGAVRPTPAVRPEAPTRSGVSPR